MSGDAARPAAAERLTREARDLLLRLAGDGAELVGIGWATVDLDRAALELSTRVGAAATHGAAAVAGGASARGSATREDPLLGARARLAAMPGSPPGASPALVLLEPEREGPLAAFLARHGEGIAAVYARLPDPPRSSLRGKAGPLGRARWRAGGRDGPFLIEVLEARGL